MIYEKRFECVDPERNHKKFYELKAELLLFGPTVTRRWGRIGCRRPRVLSRQYETWKEVLEDINAILKRRERRGYQLVEGQCVRTDQSRVLNGCDSRSWARG